MMDAYLKLGCRPTWTCAPYQAGHRPALGQHVAWGESNAVAFCNSVLGARTERYGDFLDICAALSGRAPETGLHLADNRRPRSRSTPRRSIGGWSTRTPSGRCSARGWARRRAAASSASPACRDRIDEDRLKAMGAAAASTGAVGLFHVVGVDAGRPAARARTTRRSGSPARCCMRRAIGCRRRAPRRATRRCRRGRQPAFFARRVQAAAGGARRPQARDPVLCLHRPAHARRAAARRHRSSTLERPASRSSPTPASW